MSYTLANSRCFLLLVACSGLLAMVPQTQIMAEELIPDKLTPNQIVERLAEEYAKCESYRDSGVVKTVFIRTYRKRTVEKPFTTAFVRPDRFRFDSKDKNRRYII